MSVLVVILCIIGGLAVVSGIVTLIVFALVGRAFIKGMRGL